ncbi:DUF559 domain-containing protein [Trujillonella humicola]|uniref:DUF559 domain-containing protein n=1 Tax=Trujillonella humicola TaxID=3383699 RepID=UPI003906ACF6
MPSHRRLLPGVFIGSHAVSDGLLTRNQLRTRSYRRLVQGVYADPGLPADHRLRCRGAALVFPPGVVLGGLSAAAWYGADHARFTDPVTALRPEGVAWRGPRGIRVHRTTVLPEEVVVRDDVPMTTSLRTAWDLAALESLFTAVAALDAMVRTRHLDVALLAAMTERHRGEFGVARVRTALPLVDGRAASVPESTLRVALVLAGLAPEPQHEVVIDGSTYYLDLAWPALGVAVEYDGEYHFATQEQIDDDDERHARLAAAGWLVLRLTAADLRDLAAVVARIRDLLAQRA